MTMTDTKKLPTSLKLALAILCFGLGMFLPLRAHALSATIDVTDGNSFIAALESESQPGERTVVQLKNDIALSKTVTINSGRHIVLKGNGHTLSLNNADLQSPDSHFVAIFVDGGSTILEVGTEPNDRINVKVPERNTTSFVASGAKLLLGKGFAFDVKSWQSSIYGVNNATIFAHEINVEGTDPNSWHRELFRIDGSSALQISNSTITWWRRSILNHGYTQIVGSTRFTGAPFIENAGKVLFDGLEATDLKRPKTFSRHFYISRGGDLTIQGATRIHDTNWGDEGYFIEATDGDLTFRGGLVYNNASRAIFDLNDSDIDQHSRTFSGGKVVSNTVENVFRNASGNPPFNTPFSDFTLTGNFFSDWNAYLTKGDATSVSPSSNHLMVQAPFGPRFRFGQLVKPQNIKLDAYRQGTIDLILRGAGKSTWIDRVDPNSSLGYSFSKTPITHNEDIVAITYKKANDSDSPVYVPDSDVLYLEKGYEIPQTDLSDIDHRFLGWFLDAEGAKPLQENAVAMDNLTVYGKWEKRPVVQYAWIEGIPRDVELPESYGAEKGAPLRLPNLSSEEYAFAGWFSDFEGFHAIAAGTPVTEDTLVYGKWLRKNPPRSPLSKISTVTFALAPDCPVPSEDINLPKDMATFSDKPFLAPEPLFEKGSFEGWFYDANCATPFNQGDIIANPTILYAKFSLKHYYAFVWSFGGSLGKAFYDRALPSSFLSNRPWNYAPMNLAPRDDQVFSGWQPFKNIKSSEADVLQPIWTPKDTPQVTITFDYVTDDLDISSKMNPIEKMKVPQGSTIPTPDLEAEGYVFKGWYADQEGKTPLKPFQTTDKDLTIYGKWALAK